VRGVVSNDLPFFFLLMPYAANTAHENPDDSCYLPLTVLEWQLARAIQW